MVHGKRESKVDAQRKIRICVFGRFSIYADDDPLLLPDRQSPRLLLAFLLLNANHFVPRQTVAQKLFPEYDAPTARRRLSHALWRFKQAPSMQAVAPFIETDNTWIRLNLTEQVSFDLHEFFEATSRSLTDSELNGTSALELERAVQLVSGDLFDGYDESWLIETREAVTQRLKRTLGLLITWEKQHGRYESALRYAEQRSKVEPFSEEAIREVLQLHAIMHRPHDARIRFERFQEILAGIHARPSPGLYSFVQTVTKRAAIHTATPAMPGSNYALPIVGREVQRSLLVSALDAICAEPGEAHGGVVLVEGKAGIGKSRLMQACLQDARWRGICLLHGNCQEQSAGQTLHGFFLALNATLTMTHLRHLAMIVDEVHQRALAPYLPRLWQLLPQLTELPVLEKEDDLDRVFAGLITGFQQYSQVTPVLFVLEDIHAADSATFDLFARMAHALRDSRCLFVATYRKARVRADAVLWERLRRLDQSPLLHRVTLEPLSTESQTQLLHALLQPSRPSEELQERLLDETAGNPLFLVETVRMLMQENRLTTDDEGVLSLQSETVEQPAPKLQEIVQRRLDRLSAEHRTIIDHAAILGFRFTAPPLRELTGIPAMSLLQGLKQLVVLHFLEEGEQDLQFAHQFVRQTVLAAIPSLQRIEINAQVAELLRQQEPNSLATIAHHLRESAQWEDAAECFEQLGRESAEKSSWTQSLVYIEEAIAIFDAHFSHSMAHIERAFDLRELRRQMLFEADLSEQLEVDVSAMQQAAQWLDTPYHHATALFAEAYFESNVHANYGRAIQLAAEVERLASVHRLDALEVSAIEWQGRNHYLADRYDEARKLLEKLHQPTLYAQYMLAATCRRLGNYERAVAISSQLLAAAHESGNVEHEIQARQLLATLDKDRGRIQSSVEHSRAALQLAESVGSQRLSRNIGLVLAIGYAQVPEWSNAIEQYEKLLTQYREAGNLRRVCVLATNYSYCLIKIGAFERATRLIAETLALTDSQNLPRWKLMLHFGEIEIQLTRATPQSRRNAARLLKRVEKLARQIGSPSDLVVMHLQRARLLLQSAKSKTALHQLDEAALLLTRVDSREDRTEIALYRSHALLQVGDSAEAIIAAQRAVDELPIRTGRQAPAVLLQLTIALENAGRHEEAHRYADEAHAVLSSHALTIRDERLREQFYRRIPVHRQIIERHERRLRQLAPGQIRMMLEALSGDEPIEVVWTVDSPDDAAMKGKVARRRKQLRRLLTEAQSFGGKPTAQQLADALHVGLRTIERDLAAVRRETA